MTEIARRGLSEQFHKFACSYRMDGGEWGFVIMARDYADAQRRIAAIGMTAKVDGQVFAEGQIAPAFVGRFAAWLKGRRS